MSLLQHRGLGITAC